MRNWECFSKNHYLNFDQRLDKVEEWDKKNHPLERVCSLTGAPGVGKSWTVQYIASTWGHSPKRFVFVLDCPEIFIEKSGRSRLDYDRAFNWLKHITNDVREHCSEVPQPDHVKAFSLNIQKLVDVLCHTCHWEKPPILLVDGYDEIDPSGRGELNRKLLEFFVSAGCTKIIIARRQQNSLMSDILRRMEKNIELAELMSTVFCKKQFQNIKDTFHANKTHLTETNLDEFLSTLPEYHWNHPYINGYLFDCALSNIRGTHPTWLTNENLEECCKDLVRRPDNFGNSRHLELTPSEFVTLIRIAHLDTPNWTQIQLRRQLGIDILSLESLFDRGLLINLHNSLYYSINNGLRGILRSIQEKI